MASKDDLGRLMGSYDEKADSKKLHAEIDRDQRNEAVNELYDEAQDIFWQAGGIGFASQETEDAIKAVMQLCWERWAGES